MGAGRVRVRVRYFAAHRDAAGVEEEDVDAPDGATVAELLGMLEGLHPGLRELRDDTVVSVNKGMGRPSAVLREGDEVTLIPPIAGG